MKRHFIWLALAFGLSAVRGPADTYPRQPGVDAVHYIFRLELRDDTDEIAGEATVTLRFLKEGLPEAALDLASVSAGKGMAVSEVLTDGRPLRFAHENSRLRITLAPTPQPGQELRITIRYRGVPSEGLYIGLNKYQERTFFGVNWPDKARAWLPMIDHPYDKATGEFIITAPAHYQAVANGLLVEESDLTGSRRRTHWKQSAPISSWLFTIGVARFAVHHAEPVSGIPLQTWVYPQDREAGISAFESTARRAIEFFSEHIAPYPYEKLANVEAAGLSGGTEHASAIFYGEKSVSGRPITGLVVHEIAHSWFGDGVTERDWDDVWLSEGFATYFTHLFVEHEEGRDAFVAGLRADRDQIRAFDAKNPGYRIVHDNLADMKQVTTGAGTYKKGSWTLHMLRGVVGDEAFWSGIREYYRLYRDKNASTADFRRVMEETSGRDLAWFFDEWLTRGGMLKVRGRWSWDAAARALHLDLEQRQAAEPYRMPVEVAIEVAGETGRRTERIELRERRQSFTLPLDREPRSVALDPRDFVLMDSEIARADTAR